MVGCAEAATSRQPPAGHAQPDDRHPCRRSDRPVLVSGSAVGYYGDRGEETLTETSPPGHDFLAGCRAGMGGRRRRSRPLSRASRCIRTGIVLDSRGGALPKMLPPFMLFVGGPLGIGQQYMPWIHKTTGSDWSPGRSYTIARAVPLNATGPSSGYQRGISPKRLDARSDGRACLPAPAFALRLAARRNGRRALLSGQRALPVRATDLGFCSAIPKSTRRSANLFHRDDGASHFERQFAIHETLAFVYCAAVTITGSLPCLCRCEEGRAEPGVLLRHARPKVVNFFGGRAIAKEGVVSTVAVSGDRKMTTTGDNDRANRRPDAKKRSTTSTCAGKLTRS